LISKTIDPSELKTYYAYQLENYLNLNNFDSAFIAFENYNKIEEPISQKAIKNIVSYQ
jgi:hypothetical protein